MGVDNVAAIPLSCEVITHSIISPFLISLIPPASSSFPPKGFRPKGKIPRRHSRLVARALIHVRKVLSKVEIYSQYARKNLDLFEQGPHGIVGDDDVSIVRTCK